MDWTDTQANSEPMISMTVRERDRMLHRISELEANDTALRSRIKIIETGHEDTKRNTVEPLVGFSSQEHDELLRLRSEISHVKGLLFLAMATLNHVPVDVKMGVDPGMGQAK